MRDLEGKEAEAMPWSRSRSVPGRRCRLHRSNRRAWALAVLCALPLGLTAQAWAGGFHISILGVRRTGMMTNLARPDDVTALFHNPAGLADLRGTQVHLSSGITLLGNKTKLQALDPARFPEVNPKACGIANNPACPWPIGSDGYYEANFEPERYTGVIPFLGVAHNLGHVSPALEKLTLAFALYAPGAYGAFLGKDKPTSYFITDGLFVVGAATVGAGYRINEQISVGASVSYNYLRLGYKQRFSTIDVMTDPGQAPDALALVAQQAIGDLDMEYAGDDHGMGWSLSVLYSPFSWLSFGATYAGFTTARFEGDLTLRSAGSKVRGTDPVSAKTLGTLIGVAGYKLPTALIVEMPIPHSLQFGLSVHPSRRFEVGLDFRLWLYSVYGKQTMIPLYDPNEAGNEPLTEAGLSKDKNYSQSYELALGFLVRPLPGASEKLELMAGIGFDKSPVPDETFSIDNPSMNQLVFSFGVRSRLGAWQVGAAWMVINYLERDIRTSQALPPVNVMISGTSHIPTLEVSYRF